MRYGPSHLLPVCYTVLSNIYRVGLSHVRLKRDSMVSYKLVYNRKARLDEAGTALVQIEAYQQGQRR
jgi:hypothetical protein